MTAVVVLVVEDDKDTGDLLVLVLVSEGYAPTVARDGHNALALMSNIQPAIIVSDVMMPKMSGGEFCSAVRDHPAYTDTPIIATSAMDEQTVRQEFDCYDAFIPKPYDVNDLLDLIKKLLADEIEPGKRPQSSKPFQFGKTALEFLGSVGRK